MALFKKTKKKQAKYEVSNGIGIDYSLKKDHYSNDFCNENASGNNIGNTCVTCPKLVSFCFFFLFFVS